MNGKFGWKKAFGLNAETQLSFGFAYELTHLATEN